MKKKRRSLTLIEVVIALAITGMLISFLWQSYFNCQKQLIVLEANKKSYMEKIFFHETISDLIKRLRPNKRYSAVHTPNTDNSLNKTLIFYSDAHIDVDPDFTGPCYFGLIHMEKKLLLTHWGSRNKKRTSVLMDGVDTVDFLFYNTSSKSWINYWDKKSISVPTMIKIKVSNLAATEFLFFPQLDVQPIKYSIKS
jgi:hypothetical protein